MADLRTTIIKTLLGEEADTLPNHSKWGNDHQIRNGRIIPVIHPKLSAYEHGYKHAHTTIKDAETRAELNGRHKEAKEDNPHKNGTKGHDDFNAGVDKAKADVLKNIG